MRQMEEGLRSPRVRFKDGANQSESNHDEVFDTQRNMHPSSDINDADMNSKQRNYRNYSPSNSVLQNTSQYNHRNVSPSYSNNSLEKYQSSLAGELKFLEDTNSNILIELRECQDSNYILTEELRRAQRSNINILDELQACQTANMVLRNELQRLENDNVKVSRELDKYKKANKMLREDIKELKTRHFNRRDSTRALREKAKDIVTQYGVTDGNNSKGISSLKEAIDIFAESVETESLSGYLPTDSDSMSERQSSNSDIEDSESMNGASRVRGRREFVRSQSTEQTRYHEERNGLFGRKKLANMADQKTVQQQRDQPPRVLGRRAGSMENLLDIDRNPSQNGAVQNSQYFHRNGKPTTPSNNRRIQSERMTPSTPSTPSPISASKNTLRMSTQELSTSNTWQL